MAIRIDVDVIDPDFAVLHPRETVPQVRTAFTNRLHFGPDEGDTSLEGLDDVVVVKGLAVFGDVFLGLFPLGLHRSR
jgi:hypothetical protein